VPNSIETLQDAIPGLVEVATVIDDALTTLSRFEIDQTIPIVNYRIQYDLGINYDPEVPFDQAVSELGGSLEGLPETLRGLESELATTQASLDTMGGNMEQLATDMATLNASIAEVQPILDEYIRIVTDVNDRMRIASEQIDDQAAQVKQIFNFIFLWMLLFQLVPLYLGLEMAAGERGIEQYVTEKEFAERMAKYEKLLAQSENGPTNTPDTAESSA
jgi:chromosome segregation ATPase